MVFTAVAVGMVKLLLFVLFRIRVLVFHFVLASISRGWAASGDLHICRERLRDVLVSMVDGLPCR